MFGSDNKIQCRVQSEGTAGSGKKSDTALAGIETYKKKSEHGPEGALRRQMSALFGLAAGPICSSPTS